MLQPDAAFVEHILADPYSGGEQGLQTRMDDVWRLARQWGLTLEAPMTGARCSLVFRGRTEAGQAIILKVPVVGEEKTTGATAAQTIVGHGGIPILRSEAATGALLMPMANPGGNLTEHGLTDDQALDLCAAAILELRHIDVDLDIYRSMADFDWFHDLNAADDAECDPVRLNQARSLLKSLLESTPTEVLLHGDLHHFNLLRHEEGWAVIDPKGIVGDPAREVVPFMRNPIPQIGDEPDLEALLERRLERFAEALGDPIQRLWGWSMVETSADALEPNPILPTPWRKVNTALVHIGERRGWMPQ